MSAAAVSGVKWQSTGAASWTTSAGSVSAPAPAGRRISQQVMCGRGRAGAAGLRHPCTDKDKLTRGSCRPAKLSRLGESWAGAACPTGSAGWLESEFHQHPLGMNYDLLFVLVFERFSVFERGSL